MNKLKMEPELKSRWIDALRGGHYVQAEGVLFDGMDPEEKPKMCCLGVLEHLCGNEFHIFTGTENNLEDGQDLQHMPDDLRDARKSPQDILKQEWKDKRWDGSAEPDFEGHLEAYLAHMNDYGKNFEEIADYIEENL